MRGVLIRFSALNSPLISIQRLLAYPRALKSDWSLRVTEPFITADELEDLLDYERHEHSSDALVRKLLKAIGQHMGINEKKDAQFVPSWGCSDYRAVLEVL